MKKTIVVFLCIFTLLCIGSCNDGRENISTVEPPMVTNIQNDASSIRCDSSINLSIPEEGARVYYSVDDAPYRKYEGDNGINLSEIEGLSDNIRLSFYAEKDGMNHSYVVTKVYEIVHDLEICYDWEASYDGYRCVASKKCPVHSNVIRGVERATYTSKTVVKESSCTEYGTTRYTSVFMGESYENQSRDFNDVAMLHHVYNEEVPAKRYLKSEATCTAKALYYKSCSICGAKSSDLTFEYGEALGHDYSNEFADMRYLKSEATCTEAKVYYKSCSICGESSRTQSLIFTYGEALGHSYKDLVCTRCNAWMRGSAGGYVFYDKGFYSDGWRYLEAAPADLKTIGGVPTVDETVLGYDDGIYYFVFGFNGGTSIATTPLIGYGKANTSELVSDMGDFSYTFPYGSETTAEYAARLCSILKYEHDGVVYSDWFLPSFEELSTMGDTLYANGVGSFDDGSLYWSSTSYYSSYNAMAMRFFHYTASLNDFNRGSVCRVRPVRAF